MIINGKQLKYQSPWIKIVLNFQKLDENRPRYRVSQKLLPILTLYCMINDFTFFFLSYIFFWLVWGPWVTKTFFFFSSIILKNWRQNQNFAFRSNLGQILKCYFPISFAPIFRFIFWKKKKKKKRKWSDPF